MALFGSKDKESSSQQVRPTVVRTQNVAKKIQEVAKSYEVSTDKLDFNLLETQTHTRMYDGTKETEWENVEDKDLYELDDKTALLNAHFQIKQTYEIEIFAPTSETYVPCPDLHLAVGANASKCKVYLSIGAGSKIVYKEGLEEELKTLIEKKKVRAGILVNIFDEMVKSVISKVSARARVDESVTYEKPETILIAEGFEPTPTINDKLILHYEENNETQDNTRVDYSSRGFIQDVKKDELLMEYIRPEKGTAGRNCRGEFMEPSEPLVNHEVTFEVDDSISIVEGDHSIEYHANENGYIALEENTYLIKTDMEIGEISFKTTGSINSGVDSDVTLNVSEADAVKDAIGTGMSVEVTEIDIDGNVGSNARVVAQKATVGGQTHKTATIKADELDINVHKGKAFGKNIQITRLEHGIVDGDKVVIKQALGGQIRAKEIDIDICASHVKVTASKIIEIHRLHGSENTFTIDPVLKKDIKEGLDENQDTIDSLKSNVKELSSEMKNFQILIKEGSPAFLEIKKRLVHYKKNGIKLPSAFVKKYKEFTQMQEKLKETKKEYDVKHDQLKLHTTRTASFQDNILDARVINRDRWIGYNEIRFKLVDPPIELVHKPIENSPDMIFGLVEVGDGEFEIQAVEE